MQDECLLEVGLKQEDIFFTNAARCWPHTGVFPGKTKNLTPTKEQVSKCKKFVLMEIDYIRPKIVVAAGNVAISIFHDNYPGITKCHGEPFNYIINDESYLVIPIFHPSYVQRMRNFREKFENAIGAFIQDLEYIRDILYDNFKREEEFDYEN